MKRKIAIIAFAIIILASILRLYSLGQTPASVNWDEAALGYDAYSILTTGRDQYGKVLPLVFKSLNDYKPPLYIYLGAPLVFIFGLNAFSIRFVSAAAGIIAVVLTFLLTDKILAKTKIGKKTALISAWMLATSPWHLQFSRGAFEANLALTITLAAIWLFFEKKLMLSSFFFGLSLFVYHAARFISPLICFFLYLPLMQTSLRKAALKSIIIFCFFLLGVVILTFTTHAQNRFTSISIFNTEETAKKSATQIFQDREHGAAISGNLFHNRRLSFLTYENFKKVAHEYLVHISPDFYMRGDPENNTMHPPDFGLLYFFQLLSLPVGIYFYIKQRGLIKSHIIPFWFFVSAVPASLVWGNSAAVRNLQQVIPLSILSALGVVGFVFFSRKDLRKILLLLAFVMSYAYSTCLYLHQYFTHTNSDFATSWFLEKKEAAAYTESVKNKYGKIIVSNTNHHRPYIFWLFYTKYNPTEYLRNGGTNSGDYNSDEKFNKYEFTTINTNSLGMNRKWLVIGYPEDFPLKSTHPMSILKKFYYPNGSLAAIAAENK